MKESGFSFYSVQIMYYKCHKVSFKRGGSYIDSPNWIKTTTTTVNPRTKDDKCFQYEGTVALNHEEIKCNPERVKPNIKPFINKYNWEVINYLSKINDWKTFEKNNLRHVFNMLSIKEKEILSGYILKHNSNREKQTTL